ncbi:hypothetical protein ROJ8625_00378 [Roseivivax jejudonensis]|uniref:Type II secretion system protein GspC N-terminal domain-containing protein n=1 Tax=Roseivivax jejudonensis TaxID=1529041 RepID=A0A1X6Y7U3_9RHOB|nr:type II secretion system protein N [Roseivivax jejudonensis]SLN12955.1 hypothetical protein ROJ8625_00378 [Roseivivax jejudonensis]
MSNLPRLVAICAVAALGATLVPPGARLAAHMAGHTSVVPERFDTPLTEDRAPPPVGTENILAFAPFGAQAAPTAPKSPGATARTLDLVLHGVLVASDPARSRALIAVGGGVDRYRIGDDLAENAILAAIAADFVEVDIDGDSRRFGFDGALDGASGSGSTLTSPIPDAAPPQSPLDRLRAAIVPGRGSLDLREAPPPETTKDYIDLWRERIIADPQAVLDTIGLVPGDEGYTIAEDPNIGVTMAGLKPGDRVTRVNGQDVGDPDRDRAFYDEIAASGQARLEVVRDGETLLMSFPLR